MIPLENEPPVVIGIERLTILLVNPEPNVRGALKRYLEDTGRVMVTTATTGSQGLVSISAHSFDAIISDYDMEDMNGIDLSRALQNSGVKSPFILYTFPEEFQATLISTFLENSQLSVSIQHIIDDLVQKVFQAVELYRTRNRLELYSKHLEELVEERTRQLKDAQRLAVIGELATMIGHDMRNPLQVMTNLTYILSRKVEKMPPPDAEVIGRYGFLETLTRINSEISYLNKIVSDLQDYAREVKPKKEPINIRSFFDTILSVIDVPQNISVMRNEDRGVSVSGDETLYRRIFTNLFLNAIQAMENGGTLSLSAYERDNVTRIIIADTGGGIAPDAQNLIFNPLFTTKSKGTGLGLPVVKRLVEAHNGTITLASSSPEGTVFELALPKDERKEP